MAESSIHIPRGIERDNACPGIIPGVAIKKGSGTINYVSGNRIAWGTNGLLAFAVQKFVCVVDPGSVQRVQTLSGHKATVTCVGWSSICVESGMDEREKASKHLLSGDTRGYIVFWNVLKGKKLYMFLEDGNRPIHQVGLLERNVLSLARGGYVSCWSYEERRKLWKVDLGDSNVFSYSLDPFSKKSIVVCSSSGWIYNLLQVAPGKFDVKKKFKLSTSTPSEQTSLRGYQYSETQKGQLYLITGHDVNLYDSELDKTLLSTKLQYNKSEFVRVWVNKGMIFSLHRNGVILCWMKKEKKFQYKNLDSPVRYSKVSRSRRPWLHGLTFNPLRPSEFAVVDSNGKLWLWKYEPENIRFVLGGTLETLGSVNTSMGASPCGSRVCVGMESGDILIVDLLTKAVMVRYSVFSVPVKFVEWCRNNLLVAISNSPQGDQIVSINPLTGGVKHFGKKKAQVVNSVKISFSGRYMVVLLKDSPLEVWNLKTAQLIKLIKVKSVMTVEWSPSYFKTKEKSKIEQFIVSKQGGSLNFFFVETPKSIKEIKEKRFSVFTSISAISTKGKLFICGDIDGNIILWTSQQKESRTIGTHRGHVKRLMLSPKENMMLVLFSEGTFGIWDLISLKKISMSPKGLKANALSWTRNNLVVASLEDSYICVFDVTLTNSGSSFLKNMVDRPLRNVSLLPRVQILFLKHVLLNSLCRKDFRFTIMGNVRFDREENTKYLKNCFGEVVKSLKKEDGSLSMNLDPHIHECLVDDLKKKLSPEMTIPERCLLISEVFNDTVAVKFWKLVMCFLPTFKKVQVEKKTPLRQKEEIPRYVPSMKKVEQKESLCGKFNMFRDRKTLLWKEGKKIEAYNETVRKLELRNLYSTVATHHGILGKRDEAVNLLVETPGNHSHVIQNFLHACVISASNSVEHFKQTILLVSSNLFSFGALQEKNREQYVLLGTELLCLIGEGLRACKFLQNFEYWEEAARIAKCVLDTEGRERVLTRWAHHLEEIGRTVEAVQVWLSLGCFWDVVRLLNRLHMNDLAYLFVKCCREAGVPILQTRKSPSANLFIATEKVEKKLRSEMFKDIVTKYSKFLEKKLNIDPSFIKIEEDGEEEEDENETGAMEEKVIEERVPEKGGTKKIRHTRTTSWSIVD